MKMICDVPDEVIKCIKDGMWCGSHVAEKMIENGIPLSSSQKPCEDCISRQAVLDITWEEPSYTDAMNVLTEVRDKVKELPPVNPQKPICPSAGIDCEDCPAYEDAISRKAALDAIEDDARCGVYSHFASYDDAQAFKNYIKDLPPVSSSEKPKSEWQHDHEILKAYSDGANAVLGKIRNEVCDIDDEIVLNPDSFYERKVYVRFNKVIDIIDRYTKDGE